MAGDDGETEKLIRRTQYRAEKVTDNFINDSSVLTGNNKHGHSRASPSSLPTRRSPEWSLTSSWSRKRCFYWCKNICLLFLIAAVFLAGRHSVHDERANDSVNGILFQKDGDINQFPNEPPSSLHSSAVPPTLGSAALTQSQSASILNGSPSVVLLEPSLQPRNKEPSFFRLYLKHLGNTVTPRNGPNYGVSYHSIQKSGSKTFHARQISALDEELYNEDREKYIQWMDKHDLLSKEKYDPYDDLDFPRECTRPQWTWNKRPNCLSVHDISYDRVAGVGDPHQFYNIKYLSHGAFRDSFLFEPADKSKPFVTKTKIYERDLDNRDLYKIGAEAVIMEALSPSNVTSNMYVYCGSTIVVERGREVEWDIIPYRKRYHHGRIKQYELDRMQNDDVAPLNEKYLTVEKKLDIAIAMAESLAEMHGYEGGVITNDDIALGQWLYSDDDRVILNDMNDAMFMDWNYEKQAYCKYYRSFGGTYKAPEEYDGDWLDESVDVWPMGNIIFSLLTGLMPYYDIDGSNDIQEATKLGPPHIDRRYKSRSYIEGRMVEAMNACHKVNATERVSIFWVVQHLRETRETHSKNQRGSR